MHYSQHYKGKWPKYPTRRREPEEDLTIYDNDPKLIEGKVRKIFGNFIKSQGVNKAAQEIAQFLLKLRDVQGTIDTYKVATPVSNSKLHVAYKGTWGHKDITFNLRAKTGR